MNRVRKHIKDLWHTVVSAYFLMAYKMHKTTFELLWYQIVRAKFDAITL